MSDRVLQTALACLTAIALGALVMATVLSFSGQADRTALVAAIGVASSIGSGIVGWMAGRNPH